MGVRLMQVSPIWLLLTGLSFISFIFVCNWLIRPVEVTGDAAGLSTRTSNYASNASINRATASNSTDQSSVNNQIVQPKAESEAAFVTTQAKESPTSQQAVPDLQMIEEKRVEEEKPAMQPSSSTNSKAEGKVTVQIGSYNEAGQAEERVVSLKNAGFEARSVAIEIPKRGTWYRVQSGRFINRVEAERYGKQLRDKGVVSSFITTDIQE
jgi:cell division protein FtsN